MNIDPTVALVYRYQVFEGKRHVIRWETCGLRGRIVVTDSWDEDVNLDASDTKEAPTEHQEALDKS